MCITNQIQKCYKIYVTRVWTSDEIISEFFLIFLFETKGLSQPAMQAYLSVLAHFDQGSTIFGTWERLGKRGKDVLGSSSKAEFRVSCLLSLIEHSSEYTGLRANTNNSCILRKFMLVLVCNSALSQACNVCIQLQPHTHSPPHTVVWLCSTGRSHIVTSLSYWRLFITPYCVITQA